MQLRDYKKKERKKKRKKRRKIWKIVILNLGITDLSRQRHIASR